MCLSAYFLESRPRMPYAGLQIVLFSLNLIVRLIRLGFLGTGPQVSSAVHIMVSGFGGVPKIKSIYEKLLINVCLPKTKHGTQTSTNTWTTARPSLRTTDHFHYIVNNAQHTSDSYGFFLHICLVSSLFDFLAMWKHLKNIKIFVRWS